MSDKADKRLVITDKDLEKLLRQALDETKNDLTEADEHAGQVLDKINDDKNRAGLEMYAHIYQEALKVKGSARERHLKVINMIKDRLRIKETMSEQGQTPWMIKPEQVQEYLAKKNETEESDKDE